MPRLVLGKGVLKFNIGPSDITSVFPSRYQRYCGSGRALALQVIGSGILSTITLTLLFDIASPSGGTENLKETKKNVYKNIMKTKFMKSFNYVVKHSCNWYRVKNLTYNRLRFWLCWRHQVQCHWKCSYKWRWRRCRWHDPIVPTARQSNSKSEPSLCFQNHPCYDLVLDDYFPRNTFAYDQNRSSDCS